MNPPVRFSGIPALALTFVFAGLGYAFPVLLFPEDYFLNGPVSTEVLNLNFLVAWMGLAHFVFAYSGQARALRKTDSRKTLFFILSLFLGAGILILLRELLGVRLFDFAMWVYFIPHFVKAELHFLRGSQPEIRSSGLVLYWFPALGFAFLTFALFGPKLLSLAPVLLVATAGFCLAIGYWGGVQKQLRDPDNAKYALLAFFFIGEGLVWGTYSKYMTPQFRQGVYVFHVAVASFYHYFQSYAFALQKMSTAERRNFFGKIILINGTLIFLGWLVIRNESLRSFQYLFAVSFFTFWVGLHLISSDALALLRKLKWQNS